MLTGNLSYKINCAAPVSSTLNLTLPTALRNSVPITETLTANPNSTVSGNISISNSTINLGSIAAQPYNMLPVNYTLQISSSGNIVTFNSTDEISLDLSLLNPNFDYVKGYFGQKTETLDKDSLDLGIKEIIDHLTGSFLISSPSIKLKYSNSFALPVKVDLKATGFKLLQKVNLGLTPVTLSYPTAPAERDKSDIFVIDKTNSSLPALVSMPPEKITFSGSAIMNPLGNTGRNNYLFGSSRFLGSLEIEVPLEFRMNNLTLADTVKNFFPSQDTTGSPIKLQDIQSGHIHIKAENGFPLGISVSMIIYDPDLLPISSRNKCTINATDILTPASVDASGKVTAPSSCETNIDIPREFWSSIDSTNQVIFKFTLNTSENGSKDVKIYSTYRINFRVSAVLKPEIKFDL